MSEPRAASEAVDRRGRHRSTRSGVLASSPLWLAAAGQAVTSAPILLLGTLAPSVRADLGFDELALGAAVAGLGVVGAVLSAASGWFVEHLGPEGGLRACTAITAVVLGGIGLFAHRWSTLLAFLLLAGVGVALVQPATDQLLLSRLPPAFLGRAFGIKQAVGGPVTGLLAGLAVRATTVIGWRGAFLVAAALASLVSLLSRGSGDARPRRPASRRRTGDMPMAALLALTAAGGVGTMSQNAFIGFAVSAATEAGVAATTAGVLFAGGCGAGALLRVALGSRADRASHDPWRTMSAVIGLGVAGFALMSTQDPAWVSTGLVVAGTTTWGWQGLFFLAVARANPNAPAAASGIAATGVLVGAVVGPLAFGFLARGDYGHAWMATAAAMATAAVLISGSGRLAGRTGSEATG